MQFSEPRIGKSISINLGSPPNRIPGRGTNNISSQAMVPRKGQHKRIEMMTDSQAATSNMKKQ